jgi:2-polyprenyl-3-methyl-5-hydroxy-6-metoxy-1,4-benzoquinol methylase
VARHVSTHLLRRGGIAARGGIHEGVEAVRAAGVANLHLRPTGGALRLGVGDVGCGGGIFAGWVPDKGR